MFGLGTGELLIILVIVLVIFGAGKLSEIGGALGRGIRSFKKEMREESDAANASKDNEQKTNPEEKK